MARYLLILLMVLLAVIVAALLAAGIYVFLVARDYRRQNERAASFTKNGPDGADEPQTEGGKSRGP